MIPRPQSGYIINDLMLKIWRVGCVNLSNPYTNDDKCRRCEYRGKGVRKGCCDFDDNAMQKIFKTHLYPAPTEQEIRDTVLGELLIWVKKNNINYEDADGDRLPVIVTGKIMNKIEELRTPTPEAHR